MKDDPVPFFSIVIPVRGRVKNGYLRRCLNSVISQVYPNFEVLIIDDGSRLERGEDVKGLVEEFADERFVYIRIEHSGRVIARNTGMAAARGEWLCWLDSDDAYDPMYLATFYFHIREEPEIKVWIGGVIVHGMLGGPPEERRGVKWTQIRQAWTPPLDPDGPAHRWFTSGKVGTGQFIFAREAFETVGLFPSTWKSMYDISDGLHEWAEFPMDPPFYSAAKRWCGNPYGEDFVYHLRLSKYYINKAIKAALYIQYVR